MKILFATGNSNKADEIRRIIPSGFELMTLKDIELNEDIPETSSTIEGNAIQKANYITAHFDLNCFADDTGLEIDALDGEPGVYSARYAGDQRNSEDNMSLVLKKLQNKENRSAQFKTVIALNLNGEQFLFEGIVKGEITTSKSGKAGFGYDPIFKPAGFDRTFSEMTMDEKNEISHRGIAFRKMIEFLGNLNH